MATACIAHSVLQVHGISKPIIARFDQPQASSDGGAVLLKMIDDRLGLTWRLASAIRDRRQPGKVAHPLRDLLRQRVFGLACGYADCNDAARLSDDPIHKLLLERDPLHGAALGSQPTLSRFENAVGRADLYRLGTALADAVLTGHRERLGAGVRLITIDLDATDDPTHGQQELALFNGYYDTWCYLPLIATVTFNAEPIQHAVAAVLRPGTGAATRGVRGVLRRLFIKLRALFPHARLRVRADAGFADAHAVRRFAEECPAVFVAGSFSKSLSLYGERVGALHVVTENSDEAARVLSQLKRLVRTNYSNPPTHGGKVVATVLGDPALRALWEQELGQMRTRIRSMRQQLVDKIHARVRGVDYGFVTRQRGMFSYSGLSQAAVQRLREEFSVYAIDTGRICVAALNSHNLDYVTEAIAQVI